MGLDHRSSVEEVGSGKANGTASSTSSLSKRAITTDNAPPTRGRRSSREGSFQKAADRTWPPVERGSEKPTGKGDRASAERQNGGGSVANPPKSTTYAAITAARNPTAPVSARKPTNLSGSRIPEGRREPINLDSETAARLRDHSLEYSVRIVKTYSQGGVEDYTGDIALERARQEKEKLEKKLEARVAEIAHLEAKTRHLEHLLKEKEMYLLDLFKGNGAAEQEIKELARRLDFANRQKADADRDVRALQEDIRRLEARLKDEAAWKAQTVPKLERQIVELQGEVQKRGGDLEHLKQQLVAAQEFGSSAASEAAAVKQLLEGTTEASRVANKTDLGIAFRKVVDQIEMCSSKMVEEDFPLPLARLSEIKPGAFFANKQDAECALEALLAEVLFRDFESETFLASGSTCLFSKEERCAAHERLFRAFTDPSVKSPHEFAVFKEGKDRQLLSRVGRNGDDQVYKFLPDWLAAMKEVYALHLLSQAFPVPPRLIWRAPGDGANAPFCKPVHQCTKRNGVFGSRTSFTVYPGLCLLDEVVTGLECQVYLAKEK
jgi:predicted  nucleic acid-binding Zn-ribbon protein